MIAVLSGTQIAINIFHMCYSEKQFCRSYPEKTMSYFIQHLYFQSFSYKLTLKYQDLSATYLQKSYIFAFCNTLYNSIKSNYFWDIHLFLALQIQGVPKVTEPKF